MIAPGWKFLEAVSNVTPLGIRFWDVAARALVSDGLEVTVSPKEQPFQRVPAIANRSGVFTAHGLPGLRRLETGAGDTAFWSSLKDPGAGPFDDDDLPRQAFTIEVVDRRGRFLPWTIEALLPHRELLTPACAATVFPNVPGIPLLSGPARPPVPGMAVVRVEIDESGLPPLRRKPARWAIVQVTVGAETAIGMTDEDGRALILVPYPKPGNGAPAPLAKAEWPVEIKVRCGPEPGTGRYPDICLAQAQEDKPLFRNRDGTGVLEFGKLRFGQEYAVPGDASGKVFVKLSVG